MTLKANQAGILLAGGIVLATWIVPLLHVAVLPLQYLYTHLHELGHALAAVASGGEVRNIEVFRDGSGVTWSRGGMLLLIYPAGYVGATVFGALMMGLSHSEKGAKTALGLFGGLLTLELVLWLRGDVVGVASAVGYAVLLFCLAWFVKGKGVIFAAQFLGLYQVLSSVQAVLGIVHIGTMPLEQKNDAMLLADRTGIPAIFSAVVWAAVSLLVVWWTLRYAWSGKSSAGRAAKAA